MTSDCIFCRIAKGEIPCYKIFENPDFLGFLDIRPLNPGHTLVIPKKHFRWVWDVENIGLYYEAVRTCANALRKAFSTDFVVSMVIGEEVPHAHVWLVPRHEGDGHGGAIDLSQRKEFSKDEMAEYQRRIVEAMPLA